MHEEDTVKRALLPILVICLLGAFAIPQTLQGQDKRSQWLKEGGNRPIEIVSDRLDAYREKDLVEFSGNVVATQGDRVIRSDSLMLYFKKKEGVQGAAKGAAAAAAGDIDRIVSEGNVRITEKDRIVTGDQAVFHADEQRIVVTGNPVLREGSNVVTGDRVVVLLNENRGVVEGSSENRVKATIYPDESKGKKKKE
jgi:lipopolysaccharide export system protein LptA